MRGDIFCFDEQESEVLYATQLLRRLVYPGIELTVHKIGKFDQWSGIEKSAFRYAQLIQAAIPSAASLRLNPKQDVASGRMYIRLFYSGYTLDFHHQHLGVFFPAIALHDRMCIVSQKLAEQLSSRAVNKNAFRTLEQAGVLQVDFTDDEAVKSAVKETAKQVQAEVTSELSAYASYEKDWNVDLTRVAERLQVEPGYLIYCLQSGAVERAVGRQLDCRLDINKLSLNAWTKVNLSITNKSDEALSFAEVLVTGPAKVRPTRLHVDLGPRATTVLPLAIMPLEAGDLPLEFTFAMAVDRPFSNWLPTHHVWIECASVGTAEKRAGSRGARQTTSPLAS